MNNPAIILCWRCEYQDKIEVKSCDKPFFTSRCAKEHTFGNVKECVDFIQRETNSHE